MRRDCSSGFGKRHSMGIHRPEWLEQVEGVLETLNEGVISAMVMLGSFRSIRDLKG
jgi:hypothetical protein